jgi:hypothetical protein
MLRRALHALLGSVARPEEPNPHFHTGPQGQPVPCFERSCPNPRRSV